MASRIFLRCFNSCSINYGESKTMAKIMKATVPKRRHRYVEQVSTTIPSMLTKGAYEGQKSGNSKRVTVLNKLFMRYITDLMATGQSSSEFVGHGIEISRIQVTPDFTGINIFWIGKDSEQDHVIEEILDRNVGSLRHELSQLKVVGVVPKMQFVRDKQLQKARQVDLLLAKADFGEDYVPVQSVERLKTKLELNTELKPHIKAQIEGLEDDFEYEEPLPPMRNDIFGLNCNDIMDRVQKAMKKSQAKHRLNPELDEKPQELEQNLNPVFYHSVKEQREVFQEFLHKRQVLKWKAHRALKNYKPELEYLTEEQLKQRAKDFDSFQFNDHFVEEDYIEEDDENFNSKSR